MKINLSKVGADIISALKKYPVEALLGLLFFVFFCIEDQLNWESSSELIKHIRDVIPLSGLYGTGVQLASAFVSY